MPGKDAPSAGVSPLWAFTPTTELHGHPEMTPSDVERYRPSPLHLAVGRESPKEERAGPRSLLQRIVCRVSGILDLEPLESWEQLLPPWFSGVSGDLPSGGWQSARSAGIGHLTHRLDLPRPQVPGIGWPSRGAQQAC